MGQNVFAIIDKIACFGLESPRKPTGRFELHLRLSRNGAAQFLNAMSSASERERKSTIAVSCSECATQMRIRFFQKLEIQIPSTESQDQEPGFEYTGGAALIKLPRSYLATATEMCQAMLAGENDISFKFADKIAIWIWSEECGP
ncbi:MAG: hypothetical protein ACRC1K_12680 [Planctomycetia bacterium]